MDQANKMDPLLGAVLAGRYRLERLLGQGGMGKVYAGRDSRLHDRPVAVKLIAATVARQDPQWRERFQREAGLAALLKHRNVVEIYDFGEDEERGCPFLVMELLSGAELCDLMTAGEPMAFPRVVHLLAQVCDAMQAAHDQNLIHRDLKPANLFVTRDADGVEWIKVMDFGLARSTESDDAAAALTQAGAIMGTPIYMPPEQWEPAEHTIGPSSDIYSLGVVAYQLLTGKPPFTGSFTSLYRAHAKSVATPIADVVRSFRAGAKRPGAGERPASSSADIPARLSDAVARAMAKRPEDRYPSMRAFRDELRASLSEPSPHTLRGVSPGASPAAPVDGDQTAHIAGKRRPEPVVLRVHDRASRTYRCGVANITSALALATSGSGECDESGELSPSSARVAGVIVASDESGSPQLALQQIGDGTALVGRTRPLTSSPRSASSPAAALDDDRLHLVWSDTRGDDAASQIYASVFDFAGVPNPSATPHELTTERAAAAPALARRRNDDLLIAWHEFAREPVVVLARCDPDFRTPERARPIGHGCFPAIATSPNGANQPGALVAWCHPSGVIYTKPAELPTRAEAISTTQGAFPQLVAVDDGFAMVWWSFADQPSIMIARLTNDGRQRGEPLRIGDASARPSRAAVCATRDGLVVCWDAPGERLRSGRRRHNPHRLLLAHVDRAVTRVSPAVELCHRGGLTPSLCATDDGAMIAWIARDDWRCSLEVATVAVETA